MCGEKTEICEKSNYAWGSPPHVRGKAGPNSAYNVASGITPAYAGKRRAIFKRPLTFRDHPRVCGEKDGHCHPGGSRKGSPPRMRGKEASPLARIGGMGITPAYAGKSTRNV